MGMDNGASPLELLGVIGQQEVAIGLALRHVELFTTRGLLTMLSHEPVGEPKAAVIACGGAMGGLLGPANGLYHHIGTSLVPAGVVTIRLSYRRPNDLTACCVDMAAAVQIAVSHGARRVVVMGHSFGGAVAIRVAVGLGDVVDGVVTFATQSAGCEIAGGLAGRPMLMFHGTDDEILPLQSSKVVRAIAGSGELVELPGDGHLLARSGEQIRARLDPWLREVLELA